jgi:hypothetical protein
MVFMGALLGRVPALATGVSAVNLGERSVNCSRLIIED